MNEICNKKWTELDGKLVFSFSIPHDPASTRPTQILISFRDKLMSPGESRRLVLNGDEELQVDLSLRDQGKECKVVGTFQKQVHLHSDGAGHIGIWANLQYGGMPMDSVEGFLAWCTVSGDKPCPPDPPPGPPPEPPRPDDALSQLPIVGSAHEALFPYVYMRKWPQPAPAVLQQCFVQYVAPQDLPADSLYAQFKSAGSQAQRETLAVQFIDGTAPFTPGQYLRATSQLGSKAQRLPAVAPVLDEWLAGAAHSMCELQLKLEALFGVTGYSSMQALLASADYQADIDSLWQTWFALVIMLGYERDWMASVAGMLVADSVLHYLLLPPVIEPVPPEEPSATVVRRLRDATVVAPPVVSPLPPAEQAPAVSAPGTSGWIEPYSVGDLHLVRQRLAGYQLGEVAYVENVMRGERKEVGRRRLQREVDSRNSASAGEETLENQAADLRHSLYEEMRATVAEKKVTNGYDKFNTSYGPPTQATLTGSWTESTQAGANPGTEDAVRFAQSLLNSTVGRIRRTVSQARASSTLHHSEETVCSVIDNTGGAGALTAVYHWVNKIYETEVVNYGKRLLVEFMLSKPAAEFIRAQRRMEGQSFVRPPAPAKAGVTSFRSIQPDNYAGLAAMYDVTDIEPPPPASRVVSATLRSGDETLVPIPTGYRAADAQVLYVSEGAAPVVLVGTEKFDGSTAPDTRSFGQDTAMPVSVSPIVAAAPPAAVSNAMRAGVADDPTPAPTPAPTPDPTPEPTPEPTPASTPAPTLAPLVPPLPPALVNVAIECKPDDTTMDAWRIKTYAAIMRAYQQQLARFFELGAVRDTQHGPVRSPLANRDIERAALRRGCLRLLMERHLSLADDDGKDESGAPTEFDVNEPRYLQFFDMLFEWGEMSYRWYEGADGIGVPGDIGVGSDAQFTLFLGAEMARVMLPVAPQHVMALLYFLSTGMVWDGGNRAAPLNQADIALAADLKQAGLERIHPMQRIGDCWTVVVPTTMQLLKDQLPLLKDKAP